MLRRLRGRYLLLSACCAALLVAATTAWTAPKPGKRADAVAALNQARVVAAAEAYALYAAHYKGGQAALDSVYAWSTRWREALGKAGNEAHLKRMRSLTEEVKAKHSAGMATGADLAAARYYVAEAELWARER